MPLSATRYGVAPYAVGGSIDALDTVTPNGATGVNVSGSVQVTGVLLLGFLLVVIVIAKTMGGLG